MELYPLSPPRLNRFQTIVVSVVALLVLPVLYVTVVPLEWSDTTLRDVRIQRGQNVSAIAETLASAGVIRSELGFSFVVRALGVQSQLKAGRYQFSPAMSTVKIVYLLARGAAEPDDVTVVIPEGENVWEIDQILTNAGLVQQGAFARAYIGDEGYFFPDTYRFAPDALVQEIANTMKETFNDRVGDVNRDVVTVASLLEKEGKTMQDKGIIAGIIMRRIKIGMALQIDASVAYGACLRRWLVSSGVERLPQSSTKNCDVTEMPIAYELGLDSAYNTYRREGLPKGPISNPGLEAIRAAQNPVASDYLFYLSPRDGSRIIFSKTSAEHARNRRKYLGI